MARKPTVSKQIENSLTGLVDGIRDRQTGGSYLSGYNTLSHSNNYSLLSLNHQILTYMFTGNGLFQTAIQVPIQDAIAKGGIIESPELDDSEIDEVWAFWEDTGLWDTILNYFTWVRLYGGGAIVINTSGDPKSNLRMTEIVDPKPVEFYDVDRWQLLLTNVWNQSVYLGDEPEGDQYYLNGQEIHKSRVIKTSGKKAPSRVRQLLGGWGMSEGERMIRDLSLHLKTQDVLFEILDESKVDVFKINGFNNRLATAGGTQAIEKRIQLANRLKNYMNGLVMDAEDDYENKTNTFAGLADVSAENRISIAAALRIPMVKLFGLSPAGFSTGETDLDNYNMMVESDVRAKLRYPVRKLLDLTMFRLFGREIEYTFKWPLLKEATEKEKAELNTSKVTNLTFLFDRGLMTGPEVMEEAQKEGIINIQTAVAKGMQPTPPIPQVEEPAMIRNSAGLGYKMPGQTTTKFRLWKKKVKNNSNFKEEDHPRGEDGKFGSGGNKGGSEKESGPNSGNKASKRKSRDERGWIDYLTRPKPQLKEDLKKAEKDYIEIVKNDYPDIKKEVTEEQQMSILIYTDGGYGKINEQLMKGGADKDVQRNIEQISNFIDTHPLKDETVLYRGLVLPPGEKWEPGKKFSNNGFLSSSISKDVAMNFASKTFAKPDQQAVIVFKATKGSPIAPVDGLGRYKNKEAEFIGKPGMKFRVVKATEGYKGRMEYEVEVI